MEVQLPRNYNSPVGLKILVRSPIGSPKKNMDVLLKPVSLFQTWEITGFYTPLFST